MLKLFCNTIGLGLIIVSLFGCDNNKLEAEQSAIQGNTQVITNTEPKTQSNKNNQYYIVPDSIYDGDTFRVITDNQEIKIRLCGIDAPEMNQPLGKESRDYLRSLMNRGNGTVKLNVSDKDRYGRTVAEVFVPISQEEEIAVNGEMLLAGMAYDYKQYSKKCFNGHLYEGLEAIARKEKRGVWANPNSIPPWEFRRNNR